MKKKNIIICCVVFAVIMFGSAFVKSDNDTKNKKNLSATLETIRNKDNGNGSDAKETVVSEKGRKNKVGAVETTKTSYDTKVSETAASESEKVKTAKSKDDKNKETSKKNEDSSELPIDWFY